jgi:hypothetical protein
MSLNFGLRTLIACCAVLLGATAADAQYLARSPAGAAQGIEGNAAGLGLAFVTYLGGESLLKSADDEEWVALSTHLSLRIGDRLWAQDGAKLEVQFPLGARAWLNYQSELDITRLERGTRGEIIQLALVSGEAAFDVKGFARAGSVFQLDLPGASIRAARAARFRVNTLPDGTAQIGVISGSLILETPDGVTEVHGGQLAEVQPDQRVFMDLLPESDEWDDWVRSRAAIYDRPAVSGRYLPADLSPYAYEFDTSGRWVTDRTYGTVWVPAVAQGWTPYSNGRWVWQANDYVWLSFDPWYAPFHFGRWSWGASLGWFWIVPQGRAYWSPGYVGWSVVGDEVSWVPLGRGEVYYGYGNYGPANVNVSRTTSFNVTTVYSNSRVTNGVVAVRRDDFLRGRIREARLAPSLNPFEARGKSGVNILGKPPVQEIKPIRETRQPLPLVEIKRVSLPPVRLERESVIFKKRVVAPTREKSVFKPGNKPAPLRNIEKDRDLEQWVAPTKGKSAGATVAPPAVVLDRETQAPAGKRLFKRILEPQGGAIVSPAPAGVPAAEPQDEQEQKSSPEGRGKGWGQGGGRKK